MDREKKKVIKKYNDMRINGMHYVRRLKDEKGRFNGVLVIDNNNRPVKNVYKYIEYLYDIKGYALNSLMRVAYDLCYFMDFMIFNKLTENIICYEQMLEFINTYLVIINDKFNVERSIQRSMLKEIPILEQYKLKNINVINSSYIGLREDSRIRIFNNVKDYLIFLNDKELVDIKLEELFECKIKRVWKENTIGNRVSNLHYDYSIKGYLKKAGININNTWVEPVEICRIFELDEEKIFFENVKTIGYKMLFMLLSNTGLRINEALGLKLNNYKKIRGTVNFMELESDIKLINNTENEWEVNIIPRPDSPEDLKIKFSKQRKVIFTDNALYFRKIFNDYIRYREYVCKKKKIKHEYLFINTRGERLRYDSVYKKFNNILVCSGLDSRIGDLTLHSFRHTFATKWIRANMELNIDNNLELLAKQLGHSSTETIMRIYYHIFEECKKELRRKIENSNIYFNMEEK